MPPTPATSFDALNTARELKAAGIEPKHAEAIADAMRKAALADHDTLATKADLAAVNSDVAAVRSELRWMFGFLAALQLAMAARLFGIV